MCYRRLFVVFPLMVVLIVNVDASVIAQDLLMGLILEDDELMAGEALSGFIELTNNTTKQISILWSFNPGNGHSCVEVVDRNGSVYSIGKSQHISIINLQIVDPIIFDSGETIYIPIFIASTTTNLAFSREGQYKVRYLAAGEYMVDDERHQIQISTDYCIIDVAGCGSGYKRYKDHFGRLLPVLSPISHACLDDTSAKIESGYYRDYTEAICHYMSYQSAGMCSKHYIAGTKEREFEDIAECARNEIVDGLKYAMMCGKGIELNLAIALLYEQFTGRELGFAYGGELRVPVEKIRFEY